MKILHFKLYGIYLYGSLKDVDSLVTLNIEFWFG